MPKSKHEPTTAELKREVARLNKELLAAKGSGVKPTAQKKHKFGWKSPLVVLLIVLACISLSLGTLAFWLDRNVNNTNAYMASVGPVIEQPAVQSAIVAKTESAIYANVNVNQIVASALPPKAQVLATPIASQVKSSVSGILNKVVASNRFYTVWYRTNANFHNSVITLVRTTNGNESVNVSQLYQSLSEQLKGTSLAFLGNKTIPPRLASIHVINVKWLPKAHDALVALPWVAWIGFLLTVVFSGVSLYISKNRRRLGTYIAISFAVTMGILIAAAHIAEPAVLKGITNPTDHAAGVAIWNTILSPLFGLISVLLTTSIIAAIITWSTTDFRLAQGFRSQTKRLLSWLHKLIFGKIDKGSFFTAVRQYHIGLDWVLLIIVLAILLFAFRPLHVSTVIAWTIILGVVVLLVEITAANSSQKLAKAGK